MVADVSRAGVLEFRIHVHVVYQAFFALKESVIFLRTCPGTCLLAATIVMVALLIGWGPESWIA